MVNSIRSLFAPGVWISVERLRNVGRASRASGRSWARNGRSFLATGLDSRTSGSTSSSVARRFTNVVFARRMNGGSSWIASSRLFDWRPIACVVVARWSTRPDRSARREARSPVSLELSTRKFVSAGFS